MTKISLFFILFFGSLLLVFGLFYNQIRDVFAQYDIPETEDIIVPELGTDVSLSCDVEIPIGELIDNSQDIAQRLIDEMDKIKNEVAKMTEEMPIEKANAEKFADLPDQCKCSYGCSCHCDSCCTCKKDECCECDPSPCEGSPCPFGDIDKVYGDIQGNYQKITDAFNNITASDDEINNLIGGDEVHNQELIGPKREPSWAYNILNNELPLARSKTANCFTSYQEAKDAAEGGELLLGKWFLNCEDIKSQGLVDECYPNNYFCCE